MADKWIVKPIGGQRLEIQAPDGVTIEDLAEIRIEQLNRAIAEWLEKNASASVAPAAWCIGGCGVQV